MEHISVKQGEGQREQSRDSLFMGAKIIYGNSPAPQKTVLRNLSAGGVMIDCPQGLQKDHRVLLDLRNVGPVSGTVAWVHQGRAGLMFDERVDPEMVRGAAKKTSDTFSPATPMANLTLAKGASVIVIIPGIGQVNGTVDWAEDRRLALSFDRSIRV